MSERSKGIERSREGVPIWNGDAGSFQEYEECALQWEQAVAVQKRYLCAPRLVTELTGTAKRFIVGKRPDWVSYNGGVVKLLSHLRSSLGLPQLPEMAEFLSRYFKQSRRRKGEGMNEYITRKTESYSRARQSLARVSQRYEKSTGPTWSSRSSNSGRDPWHNYGPSTTSQDPWTSAASQEGSFHEARDPLEQENGGEDPGDDQSDPDGHESWSGGWHDSHWGPSSWWSSSWHGGNENESWSLEAPELLPDYVQGWFLLHDSNLTNTERNMILAATKGDYGLQRIAQELRNQWSDEDIRRRDQSHGSGWWIDDDDYEIPNDLTDSAWHSTDDLNEEGAALMNEAEQDAQEALALLEKSKRTLKDARDRQHQVRMSRKYFRTSFKTSSGEGRSRDYKSSTRCLRCGGDHKTFQCPKPGPGASASTAESQSAPFVCFAGADPDPPASDCLHAEDDAFLSTPEVVSQGKAVLDGGATRTIGSVVALEAVLNKNQECRGSSGLQSVDLEDRPVFGFGNSSKDRCLSTASLSVAADGKAGSLKVHALDRGDGPILFSIESLRALGAIIDFREDLVCFRALNDQKVIPLERSSAGHQLLPLTQDWYDGAFNAKQPICSLRDVI